MKQRYVFTFNGMRNWVLGVVPEWRVVTETKIADAAGATSVWRNSIHDGYKISEGYQDRPLDLSNYLLLRSRMHLLMQNRVSGHLKQTSGMFSSVWNHLSEKMFVDGLHDVRTDIKSRLEDLHRIFVVENKGTDYPVAFATNSMYVLAREDGQSQLSREIIEGTLLPLVKAKSSYLHAEGLAQMAYALNEYHIWDEEAW